MIEPILPQDDENTERLPLARLEVVSGEVNARTGIDLDLGGLPAPIRWVRARLDDAVRSRPDKRLVDLVSPKPRRIPVVNRSRGRSRASNRRGRGLKEWRRRYP